MQTEHLELLSATPWRVALGVPLFMGFLRQEDWSRFPFLQSIWSLSAKWVGARKQSPSIIKGKLVPLHSIVKQRQQLILTEYLVCQSLNPHNTVR